MRRGFGLPVMPSRNAMIRRDGQRSIQAALDMCHGLEYVVANDWRQWLARKEVGMSDEMKSEVQIPEPAPPAPPPVIGGGVATIEQARTVARELARVVEECGLYVVLRGGQRHVKVEGWLTLGAMLGLTAREVSCTESDGVYTAVVEVVNSRGHVLARASAECGAPDELDRHGQPVWANRPRYARRGMAVTRATSRALRMALGWIMPLAGYSGTPAEDVEPIRDQIEAESERPPRPQKPKPRPQPQPCPAATQPVDDEHRWETAVSAIHEAERMAGLQQTPETTLRKQGLEWCRRYYAELRARLEAMEV
jgi:hypothetical protein